MAVELTATSATFNGTGVSSTYAAPIYANDDDQIDVYVDGALKTLGDDYVLNGLGSATGISIVATFPLNAVVYVERLTAIKQEVDTQNNETILEDVLDGALDKLTMIDQEQQGQINRSAKVPKGETGIDIPSKTVRATKLLGFDANGDAQASDFTLAQLAQVVAAIFNPIFTQLASLVLYLALGVGAIVRSVQSRFDDTVHVFDYLTLTQQTAVQDGTYTAGLAAGVQAAIDAAAARNAFLIVQDGTYLFDPATVIADEDTSYITYAALRIRSNMHIRGNGAVFKIRNGASSDASPKSMALFATDIALANVSVEDLVLDMNGQNNPISPNRGTGVYNRYNQSQWLVSGTNDGVANAARIDNCRLERVTFRYNPGVSACCMAQSNSANAALGTGWVLRDCLFLDNGLDSDDHSCVFGWANDVLVDGCRFIQTTPFGTVGGTGGNTGYEVHGADTRIVNCVFINFIRGIWVSSNLTQEVRRTIITGNVFRTMFYGVDFFRTAATLTEIVDTLVADNQFFFDDTVVASVPGLNFKAAVQIASEYRHREADIRNNVAYKTGTTIPAAFLVLTGGGGGGQLHTAIRCNENSGRGLTFGTFIRTIATAGLGVIDVRRNNWHLLTPSTAPAFIAVGDNVDLITVAQTIDHLLIGGGTAIDDRGTPVMNYGIRINNAIGRLDREYTFVRNAVNAEYLEDVDAAISSINNRYGSHPAIGFTPQWRGTATAVTIGDGFAAGRITIAEKTITIQARLEIGAATVIPAGPISFDLPIAALNVDERYFGNARIFDTSAGIFKFIASEIDSGGTECNLQFDGGTNVTNAAPIALAAGDIISAQITYQRA